MSEYIVETKHLNCKVGQKYLLQDITWRVQKGERWVVFGMNGCGKTTLLSIIAGFRQFTSGEVSVFGSPISDENILDIRRKIGWVSASYFDKYYTKESVMDIVLSGKYGTLGLNGEITLADRKLARTLLLELGLTRQIDYTFEMLSKGERQNVLIARALFSNPEILVLDEPCTGLDIYNREYLFQTIEKLAEKQNLTIIYVTHYVDEIKPVFSKCLLLKQGRVFAQGDTAELFRDTQISDFLNQPVCLTRDETDTMHIKVNGIESHIVDYLK